MSFSVGNYVHVSVDEINKLVKAMQWLSVSIFSPSRNTPL
jgi:hypothetical protein